MTILITTRYVMPDGLVRDVIDGLVGNLPEASTSLVCPQWKYSELSFTFYEEDSPQRHVVTGIDAWAKGFALLTDAVANGKLSCAPALPSSADKDVWEQWLCDCDADTVDALVQYAVFGELVYG